MSSSPSNKPRGLRRLTVFDDACGGDDVALLSAIEGMTVEGSSSSLAWVVEVVVALVAGISSSPPSSNFSRSSLKVFKNFGGDDGRPRNLNHRSRGGFL